ncbi:MAG TPA: AI-2E family transporter, partial [Puia sp.]|nr:AI-2E family transporter [Puia sp.]
MTDSVKLPYYARITILMVGLFFLIYILYIGQSIFIPIAYSFIFAILLTPLVNLLQRLKLNRVMAIAMAIVVAFLVICVLAYFILSQVSLFDKAIPMMRVKLNQLQFQISQWIAVHFNVSIQRIDDWFMNMRADLLANGNAMIGKTILTISGFLIAVFVIPVYMFMILYYEPLLLVFTKKLVNKSHHAKLEDVMLATKGIVQNYLNGLLIEAVIISIMNSVALLIIGID